MRWLIPALLATAFGCTPASNPANEISRNDSLKTELDSFLKEFFPDNEPGGAVIAMAGDSVVFSGAYGLSDITTGERVTTKTLFNLGSVSKTFVANGILMLRDEGRLNLNDNLLTYFPEFRNPAIGKKVTISHLLTHTSGLPDNRNPYQDSVYYLTAKDAENWAPILKNERLNFEPGSAFEYSNPAFNALALIIEQRSGIKWQTFITDRILRPSGMTASTITDGPHPASGVAHGYIRSEGGWLEKDYMEEPTFAASGNGGVWSSVEELGKYESAIRKAVFLRRATLDESRTVQQPSNWNSPQAARIGWSWFIGKSTTGRDTVGHTGSQGGFRANYQTIPANEWLVVVLSTTPRPLEVPTQKLFQLLEQVQPVEH